MIKLKSVLDLCERVLLVADPQILGDKNERWIYRWDNDRHLRQTFRQAFAHVNPTAVFFLGDLMDEGSTADDIKFKKYFKRFKKIFDIPIGIRTFYTPGDNDIGGEWPEPVDQLKVTRFKKFFGDVNSLKLNENLMIYNVNLITKDVPAFVDNKNSTVTNIILSHYPVIHRPISMPLAVGKTLDNFPSVIFSAHDHRSLEVVANVSTHSSKTFLLKRLKAFDLEALKKNKKILEIQVPSCSYRMGTLTIGYGLAVIDNGELIYSPLFVISRFYQLAFYIIFVIGLLIMNACLRNKMFRFS